MINVLSFKVEAMMTNTDQFIGRKVPPHLFEYAQKNADNWFWYKDTFVPKDLKKKDIPGGEVAKAFTRNWEAPLQRPFWGRIPDSLGI